MSVCAGITECDSLEKHLNTLMWERSRLHQEEEGDMRCDYLVVVQARRGLSDFCLIQHLHSQPS